MRSDIDEKENIILDGKNKIYSGNYIGEVKVKVDNIDNDEITFINNTNCPQSLLYAWYVNEKKGKMMNVFINNGIQMKILFNINFQKIKNTVLLRLLREVKICPSIRRQM